MKIPDFFIRPVIRVPLIFCCQRLQSAAQDKCGRDPSLVDRFDPQKQVDPEKDVIFSCFLRDPPFGFFWLEN